MTDHGAKLVELTARLEMAVRKLKRINCYNCKHWMACMGTPGKLFRYDHQGNILCDDLEVTE